MQQQDSTKPKIYHLNHKTNLRFSKRLQTLKVRNNVIKSKKTFQGSRHTKVFAKDTKKILIFKDQRGPTVDTTGLQHDFSRKIKKLAQQCQFATRVVGKSSHCFFFIL